MFMTESNLHALKRQHVREGNLIAHISVHYLGVHSKSWLLYMQTKSHDHCHYKPSKGCDMGNRNPILQLVSPQV